MASNGEGGQEHPIYGQEPVTVELLTKVGHSLEALIGELDEFSRALTAARMRVQRFTEAFGDAKEIDTESAGGSPAPSTPPARVEQMDGVMCGVCGGMMRRTGSCYTCESCGNNTGCG